jgi:hypothetical protein
MRFLFYVLSFILWAGSCAQAEVSFSKETTDVWQGFKCHHFKVDGCDVWVAEPKTALAGHPWSWCMEFPNAFTERCAAPQLLAAGFYHVHMAVGNTFGCPEAVRHFKVFYDLLVEHGLAKQAALIGLSRGGMYAYRFAAEFPECVSVIYGDAPLCDIKTVKGGEGYGKGSVPEWANLTKAYGFKDDAEALAYKGNPVDTLQPLAKAKVAIIHVLGGADDVVLAAKNSDLIEQRYKALGGVIEVIRKPGIGHHPHGLEDPKPVVDFILRHTAKP